MCVNVFVVFWNRFYLFIYIFFIKSLPENMLYELAIVELFSLHFEQIILNWYPLQLTHISLIVMSISILSCQQ